MFLLDSFFASPPFPSHCWHLGRSLALGHPKKYVCDKGHCPLGLGFWFFKNCFNFASSPPFSFSFPLVQCFDGLQSDGDLELSSGIFSSTFIRTSHLSIGGPFGMVFDNLEDVFDPKGFTNDFIQLHQLSSHVAMGHGLLIRVHCSSPWCHYVFGFGQAFRWHQTDCNG